MELSRYLIFLIQEKIFFTLDEKGIKWAINNGKMNLLKSALQLQIPAIYSSRNIIDATIVGNLQMVQWFYYNCPESKKVTPINWAAYHGHFDIVKWLYSVSCGHPLCKKKCLYSGEYTLKTAQLQGHTDITEWLTTVIF